MIVTWLHDGGITGREPASTAYLSHVLDAGGLAPPTVRSTRLVDLVNTMDPKLVAVAFGMDPEAAMIYLSDHVDPTRLPLGQTGAHPRSGLMP